MPGMKQLIFFTESFPYGKGESFIENEIEYLSREFDRIYILPKTSSTQEQRSLPANCIVFPPIFRSSGELVFKGLFCFSPLFYFFKKLISEKPILLCINSKSISLPPLPAGVSLPIKTSNG